MAREIVGHLLEACAAEDVPAAERGGFARGGHFVCADCAVVRVLGGGFEGVEKVSAGVGGHGDGGVGNWGLKKVLRMKLRKRRMRKWKRCCRVERRRIEGVRRTFCHYQDLGYA